MVPKMKLSRRFVLAVSFVAGCLTMPAGLLAAGAASGQILLPTNPLAQVSIAAKVPMAYAEAGVPGSLQLTRTGGNALEDLTVYYQVSGKAVAGQDYKALKGTKVIPAGRSTVQITINPLHVAGNGSTVKGVRVTLVPNDGYSVAAAAKASVKIVQ